jgi:hypothetical protein
MHEPSGVPANGVSTLAVVARPTFTNEIVMKTVPRASGAQ